MPNPLQSDLRKLAAQQPQLRAHLVPILRNKSAGDAHVALASVMANAQRGFLEDVVMAILRYSSKGTPLQGKSGGHTYNRGVVTGFLVGNDGGLMVQAKVKKDKIILVLSDLKGRSKQKFIFSDYGTPASIAADMITDGQGYLIVQH